MALDIVACVVAHLRNDSTLVTLLGSSTRINREFEESDTVLSPIHPQVYVVLLGGTDDNPASSRNRVALWAESKKAATCAAIHDRLRVILHEATNYTLGTGSNSVNCIRSMRGGPPNIDRDSANAAYESVASYEFNVNET